MKELMQISQAVFTARSQEDATAFLNFTLKGVVCT